MDGSRRLTLRNRRFLKKFQLFAVRAEGEVRSIPPHREPLDTDSSPSLERPTLPDDYMAPQGNQHDIISKHSVQEIEESATPAPVDKLHEIGRTGRTASDFVNPPARSDITSPEPKASDPPTSHPDASPVPAQVANPALDTVLGDQRGSAARLPSLGVTMHERQAPSSRILNQGPRMRQSLKAHRASKAFIAPPTTWGGMSE